MTDTERLQLVRDGLLDALSREPIGSARFQALLWELQSVELRLHG